MQTKIARIMSGFAIILATIAFTAGCNSDDEINDEVPDSPPPIETTDDSSFDDTELPPVEEQSPPTEVPLPPPEDTEAPDDPGVEVPEPCLFAGDPLCAPVTVPPPFSTHPTDSGRFQWTLCSSGQSSSIATHR
jgi:hypothetical protein